MKKEILVICDSDKAYARKLFEYVHLKYEDVYEVILFTDSTLLIEYVNTEYVSILLISDYLMCDELHKENIGSIVMLSENKSDIPGTVCKYTCADRLMQQIMRMCAEENKPHRECIHKGLNVIGIYSPVKRCFQTTFSITLGQILAKKYRTLYMNFEPFSGFDYMCKRNTKNDLLDLVYFSECQADGFKYRTESLVEHIGKLDYIPPAKSYLKYADIDSDRWLRLIKSIEEQTDYEYLILDLTEQVSNLPRVLNRCSKVYTIIDKERLATAKLMQYKDLLQSGAYAQVLLKSENIELPQFNNIPEEMEMLPYTDLADYIRKLLESGEFVEQYE